MLYWEFVKETGKKCIPHKLTSIITLLDDHFIDIDIYGIFLYFNY